MNSEVRNLEPQGLWNRFADLNAVPRPSKQEARVIAFVKDFGNRLGLETLEDEVGNVIIRKPATPGMEDRAAVVMQSHLDMVHQKNRDTDFDFSTQGIEMYVDGDWVRAKGTTLGADNGLGVATIMAILERSDVAHPDLEALFTVDEETGMTGAKGLKAGVLKGDILLNLDTEDDDEIGVGCAGGIDVTAIRHYDEQTVPKGKMAFRVVVKGLQGGHSGMDIHKGLGNANKIMNRLLYSGFESFDLRISEVEGGGLRNAISRESRALIVVDAAHEASFFLEMKRQADTIRKELKTLEPHMEVVISSCGVPNCVMDLKAQQAVLRAIYAAQHGVYRMSADIPGLVETSNNIAKVTIAAGNVTVSCLTRSSVESSKADLSNTLRAAFELAGFQVKVSGDYSGWRPNMDSPILKVLSKAYRDIHGKEAHIMACHAGLECGALGINYPDIDMVSFGPNIRGAHSPDERTQISSVQKYWGLVLEILKRIPKKA